MKLTKLEIAHYKNFRNLYVDFGKTDGIAVLVGVNGSGKSNLLEVLGRLFAGLQTVTDRSENADLEAIASYLNGGNEVSVSIKDGQVVLLGKDVAAVSLIALYSGASPRLADALGGVGQGMPDHSGLKVWIVDNRQLNAACLVLMLLAEKRKDLRKFLRSKLGLKKVKSIQLTNLNNEPSVEMSFPVDEAIVWRSLKDRFDLSRESPREVYEFFRQRIQPYGIQMQLIDGTIVKMEDLSEGEQRLVLLRLVYEVLADENSLILLDEPDAYLHEVWKRDVFDEIKFWAGKGRMTVLSTHSPTLIDTVESRHLIALRKQPDKTEVIQGGKLDAIKELTGGRMMLFGSKPVVLFEGHSDIQYVRRAFESLKRTRPKRYGRFDLSDAYELVSCGGVWEVPIVYERYRHLFPERPIAVFCDHDQAGISLIKKMAYNFGLKSNQPDFWMEIAHRHVFTLPQPRSFQRAQKQAAAQCPDYDHWAIEDYLSKAFLDSIVRKHYLHRSGYVSHLSFPEIKEELKPDLAKGKLPIPDAQWSRFAPLIDKLMKIRGKLTVVPFHPSPAISIVWPLTTLNATVRSEIRAILQQEMCELALIGDGIDVERDINLSAMAKTEYRLLLRNKPVKNPKPARMVFKDDALHSALRLDIAGVKSASFNMKDYLALRDGDEQQAKQLLATLFDHPSISLIGRKK